jgi:hypothetical protein
MVLVDIVGFPASQSHQSLFITPRQTARAVRQTIPHCCRSHAKVFLGLRGYAHSLPSPTPFLRGRCICPVSMAYPPQGEFVVSLTGFHLPCALTGAERRCNFSPGRRCSFPSRYALFRGDVWWSLEGIPLTPCTYCHWRQTRLENRPSTAPNSPKELSCLSHLHLLRAADTNSTDNPILAVNVGVNIQYNNHPSNKVRQEHKYFYGDE